jgi:hypothetical protein
MRSTLSAFAAAIGIIGAFTLVWLVSDWDNISKEK